MTVNVYEFCVVPIAAKHKYTPSWTTASALNCNTELVVVVLESSCCKVIPLPLESSCPSVPIHVIVVGRFDTFSALVAMQVSWYISPVLAVPCARTSTAISKSNI